MPRQTFAHVSHSEATIDDVWRALDRPQTWEAIPGVDRVFDPLTDDKGALRGFAFESVAAGRRYQGTATPRERVETRLMSWNISTSEVTGTVTVILGGVPTGTSVEVSLMVESVGTLSGMFFPMIAGALGSGFPRAVDDFASGLG